MALHQAASQVIETVLGKKASLKAAVYANNWRSKTVLTALVTETLKYKDAIDDLISSFDLLKKEKLLSKIKASWLLHVLLYEQLFGKGLRGKSTFEKLLLKHKVGLHAELVRLKIKKGISDNKNLVKSDSLRTENGSLGGVVIPRYVRVNTLKVTMDKAVQFFVQKGFALLETHSDLCDFHSQLRSLKPKHFLRDFHMGEFLLVFASGTSFHDCELYKSGEIILQDKASCLPPFLLSPAPFSHVIDACAAPGNKTTLAAALLRNRGRVTAFDISAKRIKTMRTMTDKAGALAKADVPSSSGCVVLKHEDFLSSNPEDPKLEKAEFILVDPSCSGSGILSRLNHLTDDSGSSSSKRLLLLQDFQLRALTHALSFPRARRVVYSTCSVHASENEVVVVKALANSRERKWGFRLKDVLRDTWPTRGETGTTHGQTGATHGQTGATQGQTGATQGQTGETQEVEQKEETSSNDWNLERCLRANPDTDLCNGFFVAVFERETNEDSDSEHDVRDNCDVKDVIKDAIEDNGDVNDDIKDNCDVNDDCIRESESEDDEAIKKRKKKEKKRRKKKKKLGQGPESLC